GVAVGDPAEGDEQPALMGTCPAHGQRRTGLPHAYARTGGEPAVGFIGAYVDADLSPDAVDAYDPADDDTHPVSGAGPRRRNRSEFRRCRRPRSPPCGW